MRPAPLAALVSLILVFGPAYAYQGKSASAPGQQKKKAHIDIKKWVKLKNRKVKQEIQFYDTLIKKGVSHADACKTVKIIVDNDLNVGHLSHFLRRRADAGIRGRVLGETISREVKKKAEEKKKRAAKKKTPAKPKPKPKPKPRGKSGK